MTGEGFARDGYKEQGAYPEVVPEHVACEFIKKSVRFLSPDTVSEYYPLQQPETGIFTRREKSTGLFFFSQTGHKLASNYSLSPFSPLICLHPLSLLDIPCPFVEDLKIKYLHL